MTNGSIWMVALMLTGCGVGGNCVYEVYSGTCTGTGDGLFTFEGEVQGEQMTLLDNGLDESVILDEGESMECDFELIRKGTCTPCMFDIGGCGNDAWDVPMP